MRNHFEDFTKAEIKELRYKLSCYSVLAIVSTCVSSGLICSLIWRSSLIYDIGWLIVFTLFFGFVLGSVILIVFDSLISLNR